MTDQRLTAVERDVAFDYKNPQLAVEERVADLLSRMTLQEKIAQMMCVWRQKQELMLDEHGNLSPEKLKHNFENGIGQVGRISDTNGGLGPDAMASFANVLQRFLVEETRLGIPAIFHEECLHGLAAKDATSYPQPIGLASTFDPELIEELYTAIAAETRARGAHQALTPVVDVARDPRWGRVEETFGEDTYLATRLAVAAVRGFQGDGRFRDGTRVLATLKHFAAHGQPEAGTNCGPVSVGERELRDTFLRPFRQAINEAHAVSVMASYNEIDGVPSHANAWLLGEILRKEWGFTGFVVSDYFAITELCRRAETVGHHVAHDNSEAARLAVEAGVNIELPDPECYPHLLHLVQSGEVSEHALDDLVAPMLRYKFLLGLFEHPYVQEGALAHAQRLEQDRDLALRAARETIVLLRNEGPVLPLNLKPGSIVAVIGPNADRQMLGGYSGKPKYYTSILKGIKDLLGASARVLYHEGCKITIGGSWDEDTVTPSNADADRKSIAEAVAVAQQAEVIILAVGGNEQTSREGWSKVHLGDRADLGLVGMQTELITAMVATGKPVVVVLCNGRPNAITEFHEKVPAILECWYLGQEGGRAVADVLFGRYNPGGKLPISFPRSVGHLPAHYSHKPTARRGYLFDTTAALYPFGFGLSYTKFQIDNVHLAKSTILPDESTTVSVTVRNVGEREGDEVVQLYIHDMISSATRPIKELRGFKRIHLAPGETRNFTMPIGPDELAFTNIRKEWVVEPGEFEILVGNSSCDQDALKVRLHVVRHD